MMNVTQYSVNIAMEATMLLVLVVLLVTCFMQKKYFPTTTPFVFLQIIIIGMLINQIVTWSLLINDIPLKYGAMPMRVVYISDAALYYCACVAFYSYVKALVKSGYKKIGVVFNPGNKTRNIMIVWGVLCTLCYSVSLFVPSIYHVENGEAVFSIPAYIVMHVIEKVVYINILIFIIKHRKVLGKTATQLSSIFIILVAFLVIVDELCGLCISYVLMSLFVFILYVRIDLHRGLLIERQEREIGEWKTQIMLSQMQPHFLYNVFTTISSMCEIQNALEARDVVNRFADYFRANLESLGKEKTISFNKELEHVKTYLWLEKIRFEDSLNICYEIESTDFEIPSLVIQPIVENAVKHGLHPKEDMGTITIRTYDKMNEHVVVVEDDGVGFDVNEQQNDDQVHIGIENVKKRLEIISNGVLEISSEIGKGTIVTMRIPKGE